MSHPEQRRTLHEFASDNSVAIIGTATALAVAGLGTYSELSKPIQAERANTEQFEAGFDTLKELSGDSVIKATRTESGKIALAHEIKTAVTDTADALGADDGSADEYLLTHIVPTGALREMKRNRINVKSVSVYDSENKNAIGVSVNENSGIITIPMRSNQSVDSLKNNPSQAATGRLEALLTAVEGGQEGHTNITEIAIPSSSGPARMVANPNYISSSQANLFRRVTEHSRQLFGVHTPPTLQKISSTDVASS